MNTRNNQDLEVLAALVGATHGTFDPNAIAAAMDGQLQRPDVAGLARDPEAVLLLRVLRREPTRSTRVWIGVAALAACLLAGVVSWSMQRGSRVPTGPLGQDQLLAAVAQLRETRPDLFAQLQVHEAEALASISGTRRGGIEWLRPRGTLLRAPTMLRWRNRMGTTGAQIEMRGPEFSWRVSAQGESTTCPPLAEGRYLMTIRPIGGLAGQPVRRSFVVASAEVVERFDAAREHWQSTASRPLWDLLEMHHALSLGLFEQAESAAARAAATGGGASKLAAPLLEVLER